MSLLLFANPCRPSSFEIVEVMSHRRHPWVLKICLYRPKLRLKIFQKHHFKGRITSISIHAHPIQAKKHSKKFKLLGFFCNISSLFGSSKNVNFGCGGTVDIFCQETSRAIHSTRCFAIFNEGLQVLSETIRSDDYELVWFCEIIWVIQVWSTSL